MATQTKADKSFETKLKVALVSSRDFAQVERVFNQYGHYLELVGGEPEHQPPTEYTIQFNKPGTDLPLVAVETRRIA